MISEENRVKIREKMMELLTNEAPDHLWPFLTLFENRPNLQSWKNLEMTLNNEGAFKICALRAAKMCSEVN